MRKSSVIFAGLHGTMSCTTRGFMEYSYSDCLSEEIEILRLMLYRDDFMALDPNACNYFGPLLNKIKANMNELADLGGQSAA